MSDDMFRPPINRALRTLDQNLFQKECLISAAKVKNIRDTSNIRKSLVRSRDIFTRETLQPRKDIFESDDGSRSQGTWSPTVKSLVEEEKINLIPHNLTLTFNDYALVDILKSILPEDLHDEIPTNFNHAGHIAHLNLRDRYLPYKSIIGQVFLARVGGIRTVINKAETLGSENEFRVLDYELLAGEDDLNTTAKESGCVYRFDYSKVFWNSRLGTEHQRLADKFQPGEAVCDAMAGVGPFAVPAAKKGCFVWANDLNPDCYECLEDAISLNKVTEYIRSANEDAHDFIRNSGKRLLNTTWIAKHYTKISRSDAAKQGKRPEDFVTRIKAPKVFSHYVMNLPSTAMDFLPDFVGLYAGFEELFERSENLSGRGKDLSGQSEDMAAGGTTNKLPLIHCYTFGAKADTPEADKKVKEDVCRRISEKLGCNVSFEDEDTEIFDVRDVAPNKRQLCATFRLPAEVAFRKG